MPEALAGSVQVGTIVRIALHGRRMRGWVVADGIAPVAGRALRPLTGLTGYGPSGELIELARWAAWRWAGPTVRFLRTASPLVAVRALPVVAPAPDLLAGTTDELAAEALALPRAVVRRAPAIDLLPLVLEAARRGTTLVVAPSQALAVSLSSGLRAAGVPTALMPRGWAQAAAGARVVVGARAAAWAPAVDLAAVVVIDEHDEAHQEQGSPTWHARDVAGERAQRTGAACVWVSPCPSLEALDRAPVIVPSRAAERAGWPAVDVVDRRREEPLRADLYSPRLVEALRTAATAHPATGVPMICVLNRKGRAGLVACASCGELARCATCGATVATGEEATLVCRQCAASRPALCLACGATRLKVLRPGVRRARDDLERLAGAPVEEVTGDADPLRDLKAPILVGTEAVLHRVPRAGVVAFLDLDAELLAPRYRAAEQALALLARAARLLGGKASGGRLLLQTRLPSHEVVQAALHADPGRLAEAERRRREALRFPPATALATVSGAAAPAFVDGLSGRPALEIMGPSGGAWLVRAADHRTLCDALAAVPRPPGRLRVAVDPPRI